MPLQNVDDLLGRIRRIHAGIRASVLAACEGAAVDELARVTSDKPGTDGYGGDTLFALDEIGERRLLELCGEMAEAQPLVLVAEGLPQPRGVTLPYGADPETAELKIIVDPIDGTRGLMYQKRPGWILTGVAPNHGPETCLADIELAVQTEIPLVKQHLCDTWWAVAGRGAAGERLNRLDGATRPLTPTPSRATTLAHGYGGLARFFPGDITELAAIEDAVVERILGPKQLGKAHAFNDQYASTGGQLAELISGHDRWLADLRPLLGPLHELVGRQAPICCHPYDICTELIAREAGVIVTDEQGQPLCTPLDASLDVTWVGYANHSIREIVAPVLHEVLHERGLLL